MTENEIHVEPFSAASFTDTVKAAGGGIVTRQVKYLADYLERLKVGTVVRETRYIDHGCRRPRLPHRRSAWRSATRIRGPDRAVARDIRSSLHATLECVSSLVRHGRQDRVDHGAHRLGEETVGREQQPERDVAERPLGQDAHERCALVVEDRG